MALNIGYLQPSRHPGIQPHDGRPLFSRRYRFDGHPNVDPRWGRGLFPMSTGSTADVATVAV